MSPVLDEHKIAFLQLFYLFRVEVKIFIALGYETNLKCFQFFQVITTHTDAGNFIDRLLIRVRAQSVLEFFALTHLSSGVQWTHDVLGLRMHSWNRRHTFPFNSHRVTYFELLK